MYDGDVDWFKRGDKFNVYASIVSLGQSVSLLYFQTLQPMLGIEIKAKSNGDGYSTNVRLDADLMPRGIVAQIQIPSHQWVSGDG